MNGIVDPAQKRQFAVSVGSLAERLQLPLWFVELRHAGTHEYLPSLQVLRNGARQVIYKHVNQTTITPTVLTNQALFRHSCGCTIFTGWQPLNQMDPLRSLEAA